MSMKTLEEALIDLNNAVDGKGRPVRLFSGAITYRNLQVTTSEFVKNMIPDGTVFLDLGPDGSIIESTASAAAAWENLAKLATTCAATLREPL